MSARDLDLSRDLLPVATADLHVPCDDTPLFAAATLGGAGTTEFPSLDTAAAALPAHYPTPRRASRPVGGSRGALAANAAAGAAAPRGRMAKPNAAVPARADPPSGKENEDDAPLADVATRLERLEAPSSSASDVRESASPLTPAERRSVLAAFGDGAERPEGGAFAFFPSNAGPSPPAAEAREGGSRGSGGPGGSGGSTRELGTLRALGSPLSSYSPALRAVVEKALAGKILSLAEKGALQAAMELEERRERARLRAASVSPYDPKTPPAPFNTPTGANFPAMTDDRTPSTDNSGVVALAMLTPTTNASSVASLPGGDTPTDDAGTTPDATCALARALANRREGAAMSASAISMCAAVDDLRAGKIVSAERLAMLERARRRRASETPTIDAIAAKSEAGGTLTEAEEAVLNMYLQTSPGMMGRGGDGDPRA